MSGPKISVYSLTGRASTVVMGQINCEQKSLACYLRTKSIIEEIQSRSLNFDSIIKNSRLLSKRIGCEDNQTDAILEFEKRMTVELDLIKQQVLSDVPKISPKYIISEEEYAKKRAEAKKYEALQMRADSLLSELNKLLRQNKKNTAQIQRSINEAMEELNENQEVSENDSQSFLQRSTGKSEQEVQESIIDDLQSVYSFEIIAEENPASELKTRKDRLLVLLNNCLEDDSLSDALVKEIRNACSALKRIDSMHYLNTFESLTVKGITRKIDEYKQAQEQEKNEFDKLIARYKALCAMTGELEKTVPFSSDASDAVRAEIEKLERTLTKQREQAYISECVDEIMTDMGYELIGTRDVKKRSGKRFKNELFTFDEGTAVNVTFSSDGQISMELGGLASEDRLPTSGETDILTRDMERFCGEFKEFERRMLEKGIVVGSRIALYPPSPAHAAIINVNDYDVNESKHIDLISSNERNRRQVTRKVMKGDQ